MQCIGLISPFSRPTTARFVRSWLQTAATLIRRLSDSDIVGNSPRRQSGLIAQVIYERTLEIVARAEHQGHRAFHKRDPRGRSPGLGGPRPAACVGLRTASWWVMLISSGSPGMRWVSTGLTGPLMGSNGILLNQIINLKTFRTKIALKHPNDRCVQGPISLLRGVLSFGLAHYSISDFELLAEELLMSDSMIRVYGAFRMSVKMFLMWNSRMLIDGGGDENVATSSSETSNLIDLRQSSVIHSNTNLGVHGQGLLNLTGPGDCIEAQRLVLSLFYSINIGPGSILCGPLKNSSDEAIRQNSITQDCSNELLHPPEDCNVNSSPTFTLQICRVEDILVEGFVEGSVVHFHRARTMNVQPFGVISTSGMGCHGGIGQGEVLSNGLGSGGGHSGRGGMGCYDDTCVSGGVSYANANLPCELGSGSGNDSLEISTAGGGTLVMGSAGGHGSLTGGGGGGGGRIHFHWSDSDIPTGDVYWPIATVNGAINTGGGLGAYKVYGRKRQNQWKSLSNGALWYNL
ncbi:hypothetical protein OROHE_014733 [Orobanche hederae]